jgi:hypothetical protein
MGDGNNSSYRWDKNRTITDKQQATYWKNKYMSLQETNTILIKENTELALHIAKLNKLLTFKKGDEICHTQN